MTSKISFFNIAREDMRRRVWMLALSCLGSFLSLPIAFLLCNTDYLDRIDRLNTELSKTEILAEYYGNFFRSDALLTVGAVLTAGSIITAIWGFRYLYSRKMVDLYHSIPVKRERLFFVVYLNGLLIWLVPFLVAVGITLILVFANMAAYGALAYFGAVAGTALRLACVAILCYLSFYHILLVGVMLSGNAFNALFVTAVLSAGAAALFGILQLLCSYFYDTFVSTPVTWWHIVWTSPLVCPFFLMTDFAATGAGALFIHASASNHDPYWLIRIGNLLVMIFNLLVAFLLYRKRPSELSEHGVDHKRAQSLVRIVTGAAAGLFGSLIFLWIVDKEAIAWQIFGILLCGIFAFGVTDIILHMNFKCFFRHKKQMLITVGASCLILFVFAFDLTGFDSRLPAKNHIKSAGIFISNFDDDSYRYQFREDGTMYWNYDYYEERSFENLDALYPLLEQLTDETHELNGYTSSIDVTLNTALGPFRRRYRIHQSDLEMLRPIIESEEYLQTFYPLSNGQFPYPVELHVDSRISYTECAVTDTQRIQEIMDAYTADFRDNCTIEELRTGIEVASLQVYYPYEREGSRNKSNYSLRLDIYSHYGRTIEKLTEYYPELILEKENVNLTRLQLNAELTLDEVFQFPEDVLNLLKEREATEEADEKKPAATDVETTTAVYTLETKQQIPIAEVLMSEITISDPEEIKALLPYLYLGDVSYSPFENLREYIYLGYAEQASGYSTSCYLRKSDLPIKAPDSIVAFITKNH